MARNRNGKDMRITKCETINDTPQRWLWIQCPLCVGKNSLPNWAQRPIKYTVYVSGYLVYGGWRSFVSFVWLVTSFTSSCGSWICFRSYHDHNNIINNFNCFMFTFAMAALLISFRCYFWYIIVQRRQFRVLFSVVVSVRLEVFFFPPSRHLFTLSPS